MEKYIESIYTIEFNIEIICKESDWKWKLLNGNDSVQPDNGRRMMENLFLHVHYALQATPNLWMTDWIM